MRRFAVGYFSAFDGELTVEIVEADSIQEAIGKHPRIKSEDWNQLPEDLEEIKDYFFNADAGIDVVEIPQ